MNEWVDWKEWETLTLKKNGAYPEIALLTLSRAGALNAISDTMMDNMHDCLDFLKEAYDCRVLVLNGAGRVFCAGADLTTNPAGDQNYDWADFPDRVKKFWQLQQKLSSAIAKLRKIPQPVISAIHKAAVGGGMAMANASDIVVASRGTRFINAFIKIGVSGADCGSSYFLPRMLGFHRSAELLYSGRDLLAEEAYEWGYVNFLVDEPEEVVEKAVAFAAEYMLTKSPMGLRLTKEALNMNMDAGSMETAMLVEDRNQTICAQTEDVFEGVAAFFEKRKAKYGPR
jgi:enoyl-CoA hydratase